MTPEQVIANAKSDPDNLPVDEPALRRMVVARMIRRVRERAGLSQAAFARTFHINLSRLQDAEQGRANTDPVLVNYISLIADDLERAKKVVKAWEAA